MKFKKGSKVEVLSRRDVPSGSWFGAEIVSGNGHYYNIKYTDPSYSAGSALERVPSSAIRPCPPRMASREWPPGEFVEVFENNSWKPGWIVEKIGCGNDFFVRVIRSTKEVKTRWSNIRLRQAWEDNKWVLIDKDSKRSEERHLEVLPGERKFTDQKLDQRPEIKKHGGAGRSHIRGEMWMVGAHHVSLKGMKKRSQLCLPSEESYVAAQAGRMKGVAKRGRKRQRLTDIPEKVDDTYDSLVGHMVFYDSDTVQSSVGSCSPSRSQYTPSGYCMTSPTQDMCTHVDHVEVPIHSGGEPSEPTRGGDANYIHQMELNAYRFTMRAFYVSGPLSWSREATLTNLRLELHITNDEHLLELRHLKS